MGATGAQPFDRSMPGLPLTSIEEPTPAEEAAPMTVNPIAEYLAHLEARRREGRCAASTVEHYADIISRADRQLGAGLPYSTGAEIEEWINTEGGGTAGPRGRQKGTREHYRIILNGFFKWAISPRREDPLDINPIEYIDPYGPARPRKRRAPGDEVVRDILARSKAPLRRWFLLSSYLGMRCCELAAADREWIGRDETLIVGKGGVERSVPTHPAVWAEVRNLRGALVVRADGRPAGRHYVSQTGNAYLHGPLGLAVTMHDFRRYFATVWYEATGHDIVAVQELLGHSQVTTTQRYITSSRSRMSRVLATLPELV